MPDGLREVKRAVGVGSTAVTLCDFLEILLIFGPSSSEPPSFVLVFFVM